MTDPLNVKEESRTVRRRRIWLWSLVVMTVLLPLVGCSGDEAANDGEPERTVMGENPENPLDGSFVGKVSGTNAVVAVVAKTEQDPREAEVYLADGRRVSEWFFGSISDNSFLAKSDDGDAEAEGKLSGESVTGTVELPNGKTVRYKASRPAGAAGLYDLTVSSRGKLSGTSAAGLGVAGRINLLEGTGVLRLADGRRLKFDIAEEPVGDLIRLRAGHVRLIVLPDYRLRGVGKSRPTEGDGERAFFIFG